MLALNTLQGQNLVSSVCFSIRTGLKLSLIPICVMLHPLLESSLLYIE